MRAKILSIVRNRLLNSLLCTALFAVVLGTTINCGGGGGGTIVNGGTQSATMRLITHEDPNMTIFPPSGSPILAAFFQSPSAPSQLEQSFQSSTAPTSAVPWNQASGFVLPGSDERRCFGIFAHIGDTVDTSGNTCPLEGFPIITNGTLSSLVVRAYTGNFTRLRCTDLSSTASVTDGQIVAAWMDLSNASVVLAIGATRLSLTCTLNANASDIQSLTVQWAKT